MCTTSKREQGTALPTAHACAQRGAHLSFPIVQLPRPVTARPEPVVIHRLYPGSCGRFRYCVAQHKHVRGIKLRPGRTSGGSVRGILEMDIFDWSKGIRYHIIDTRPDTECKKTS